LPDVEPSSLEGEQTDVERGEMSTQASGASETAVKRPAESLARLMVAEVCFDVAGGAYTRRRAPLRAGSVTTTPMLPQRQANAKDEAML